MAIEVETDPEHKGWTELFSGPFDAESLLYAARVLRQAARNIDPEFKLVVIE